MKNYKRIKPNGAIRYRVAYQRGFHKGTRSHKALGLYIDQHPDKLVFTQIRYRFSNKQCAITSKKVFVFKKSKNCFRLFELKSAGGCRDSSARTTGIFRNWLSELKKPKSARSRMTAIVKRFLKKHKIFIRPDIEESLLIACYPCLKDENLLLYFQNTSSAMARYFRQPTFKQAVKKCFGFDTPKLYHLVCEKATKAKNFNFFETGTLLKGLIPLDWFYRIDDNDTFGANTLTNFGAYQDTKKLLKNYNSERIFKLIQEKRNLCLLNDSVLQYKNHKTQIVLPAKPTSLMELHDDISKQVRKLKNPDFPIKISAKWEGFSGAKIDDIELVFPRSRNELIEYGNKMNNCIAGYAERMRDKQIMLLGLKKNNELFYNISINNKRIEQFYGKRNSPPDPIDRKKVTKFLEDNELIHKNIWNQDDNPNFAREYRANWNNVRQEQNQAVPF